MCLLHGRVFPFRGRPRQVVQTDQVLALDQRFDEGVESDGRKQADVAS
jgi:hypothetical protein